MIFYDRQTRTRIEIGPEFKLVYQGGHHNVYCNGERHYRSSGGWTRKKPGTLGLGFTKRCDCAEWNAPGWNRPQVSEH